MGNGNSRTRTSSSSHKIQYEAPPTYYESVDDPMYGRVHIPDFEDPAMKIEAFKALEKFDTVVVLDDSGSMTAPVRRNGPSRWTEAKQALASLAEDCGEYDSDGIDIHFLNHTPALASQSRNFTTAAAVREYIDAVSPSGSTPIGAKLDELLSAYMQKLASGAPTKLLNVLVITDGGATDVKHLKETIARITRNLDAGFYPLRQIGIQFIQIGTAKDATNFLNMLDDGLTTSTNLAHRATRDIIDTVACSGSGGSFNAALLLKILTGGIDRSVDNETTAEISRSRLADSSGKRDFEKPKFCY